MQVNDIITFIGEKSSLLTETVLSYLNELGINITASKLLNLVLILGLLYTVISVIDIAKKPLKWVIIILLSILGLSTLLSMF